MTAAKRTDAVPFVAAAALVIVTTAAAAAATAATAATAAATAVAVPVVPREARRGRRGRGTALGAAGHGGRSRFDVLRATLVFASTTPVSSAPGERAAHRLRPRRPASARHLCARECAGDEDVSTELALSRLGRILKCALRAPSGFPARGERRRARRRVRRRAWRCARQHVRRSLRRLLRDMR